MGTGVCCGGSNGRLAATHTTSTRARAAVNTAPFTAPVSRPTVPGPAAGRAASAILHRPRGRLDPRVRRRAPVHRTGAPFPVADAGDRPQQLRREGDIEKCPDK